ncbi:hypothetical protein GGS23DRAFT_606301 [Durotheca rogersii]|uniref:uncharacterized protein n=1 Tax=Durotheca rogersii TaxID=419775 RepID=UPI0022207AAE|nr:uncharacterized protein GGS23DRAFT_606301 [Durotheca rogersii]KAI5861434.1 hypothetical protein GGS23DRAFT_606301 [Durotheca rogersii]
MHLVLFYLFQFAALWLSLASTQSPTRVSSTVLAPIYEQGLSNLKQSPVLSNPYIGGLDWRMCCKLAVNETVFVENGTLFIRPGQTFFTGTIESLEEFPRFPCGAQFDGNLEAPRQQFWVPYSWCHDRCPGWGLTKFTSPEEWLKPMILFIIPSVAFCLNIPRRRRLRVPSTVFSNQYLNFTAFLSFILKLPLASFIITLDIVVWTCVVFSTAGIMMTSGVYEALLDARVLGYLRKKIHDNSFTVLERACVLLVVLIGNLDDDALTSSRASVDSLPNDTVLSRVQTERHNSLTAHNSNETAAHAPQGPDDSGSLPNIGHIYTREEKRKIDAFKQKLKAILDSQVSFGSSVGAPVVFYIASFIWSVYEVREDLGSYLTAHQLAYGMFWTTIPHVALVSCLLLATNNTNIWEAAAPEAATLESATPQTAASETTASEATESEAATPRAATPKAAVVRETAVVKEGLDRPTWLRHLLQKLLDAVFASAYETSKFKSAWMWNRGENKGTFIRKVAKRNEFLEKMYREVLKDTLGKDLVITESHSYNWEKTPLFGRTPHLTTPQSGFGCRSLIILSYGASQLWLQMLWLLRWYITSFEEEDKGKHAKPWLAAIARSPLMNAVWLFLVIPGVLLGALSSIGGTILMLLNVLTNCLCAIPTRYWAQRWSHPKAQLFVDDATKEQVDAAQTWWFPAGIAAAVFMVVVAYMGWWYQKSLRERFRHLADSIDYVDESGLREQIRQQNAQR